MPKYKIEGTLISEFIKKVRTDAGYSTSKIAKIMNFAPSSYNGYETGKTKSITLETFDRIFRVTFKKEVADKKTECLTGSEEKSYREYVAKKINRFLHTYNKERLQNEVWLHALYLEYTDIPVNIIDLVCSRLKKLYNVPGWKSLFATLNDNISKPNPNQCSEKNVFYIQPLTQVEIDAHRYPIPRIYYQLSETELENMENTVYDEPHLLSVGTVFMLFFNVSIKNGLSEQEAFENVCKELHLIEVPNIYRELNVVKNLPSLEASVLHEYDEKLFKEIRELFGKLEISDSDTDLELLMSNLTSPGTGRYFMKIIAVDFSFISKLSTAPLNELERRVKATVENFKDEFGL